MEYATVYCEDCGRELTLEEQLEIAANKLEWKCPQCREEREEDGESGEN